MIELIAPDSGEEFQERHTVAHRTDKYLRVEHFRVVEVRRY